MIIKEVYICEVCKEKFSTRERCRKHETEHKRLSKIKPCPFCGYVGGNNVSVRRMNTSCKADKHSYEEYGASVICNKCHARGSLAKKNLMLASEDYESELKSLKMDALDLWNKGRKFTIETLTESIKVES